MKRASLNTYLALATVALVAICAATPAVAQTSSGIDQGLVGAINNPHRTPAFILRDQYRHPQQTLEFFGIRPNMTVIEVPPGGGWYTEILAPYSKDHGHLIEALPPTSTSNLNNSSPISGRGVPGLSARA